MLLAEHHIAKVAIASSTLCLFNQVSMVYSSFARGDHKKLDFNIFFTGFLSRLMWLVYGIKMNDENQINISMIGSIVSGVYLSCYFYFRRNVKVMAFSSIVSVVCYAVLWLLQVDQVGKFCMLIYFVNQASPLGKMLETIKRKDSSCLDLPYLAMVGANNFCWAIYGHVYKDIYVYLPNLFGTLFSIWSLSIFFFFKKPYNPYQELKKEDLMAKKQK